MTARGGTAEAQIAAINTDFPSWHAFLSKGSERHGSTGGRVWAARALPVSPREEQNRLTDPVTACGITVDADTPAQMRALLEREDAA